MSLAVEEIEERLEGAGSEIERVNLLNAFAYELFRNEPEYALKLVEEAGTLSQRLDYKYGLAMALANKGFHSFFRVNDKRALSFMEESVKMFRQLPPEEREGFAKVLNGLGCIKMNMAQISESAKIFREALNLAEANNETDLIGKIYTNLSSINMMLGQYENSYELSGKAVRFLSNGDDYANYVIALNNIGDLAYKMGRIDEAIGYLKMAEEVIKLRGLDFLSGSIYLTMGELYQSIGSFEAAEENLLTALKENIFYESSSMITKSYFQLGSLYRELGRRRKALSYLNRALQLAEERAAVHMVQDITFLLYQLYNESGSYKKALTYFEHYYSLKEKSFSVELDKTVRDAEAESLKRINERVEKISAIGREIASALDLKKLLETIYSRVNELLDAYNFGVASFDQATGLIDYNIYVKERGFLPPMSFSVDDRQIMASYAIRNREDILIKDLFEEYHTYIDSSEPTFLRFADGSNEICRSILFVPLLVEENVIGVVSVQSNKVEAYSQNDMDTLKALSSYIAIALNNSHQAELIREKNEELKRMAITDYLTGIYNRREFENRIKAFWNLSARKNHHFSIILLDADHFKYINDTYGHPAGDECLKELAKLLMRTVSRPDDCLARYGGEEFIILLNCPEAEALERAEQLRREIESHTISYQGQSLSLTVSIGVSSAIASSSQSGRGPEFLISRADEALYRSKAEGRNRVTYLPLKH